MAGSAPAPPPRSGGSPTPPARQAAARATGARVTAPSGPGASATSQAGTAQAYPVAAPVEKGQKVQRRSRTCSAASAGGQVVAGPFKIDVAP